MNRLKLLVTLLTLVFIAVTAIGADNTTTSDPKSAIEKQFKRVLIEQLGVDPKKLSANTNLRDDLGADNTDLIELCMAIEDSFDITISDDKWWAVTTIDSAVELISDLKNPPSWHKRWE